MADKKPRTTRTPAERAENDYNVAQRLVKRLTDKKTVAVKAVADIDAELAAATTRRNAYQALATALSAGPKGAEVAEVPPMSAEES